MIKSLIKTSLFISIFTLFLSLPLFAMNEFELDVGKHSLTELRKIPKDNFKKSHIKLNNITSDKKLFDDNKNHTQSIGYKLLSVIHDSKYTMHTNPLIINKIEYTYAESEKKKPWQYHVYAFMEKIANGIEIIKQKDTNGEWFFVFNDLRPKYSNFRCYNIVITHNNERVKPWGEVARSILLTRLPNAQQPQLAMPIYDDKLEEDKIQDLNAQVFEMTINPSTGETGWISQEDEKEEDRRDDLREKGLDPDDD